MGSLGEDRQKHGKRRYRAIIVYVPVLDRMGRGDGTRYTRRDSFPCPVCGMAGVEREKGKHGPENSYHSMQRQDLVPGQGPRECIFVQRRWDDACNKTGDWWIAGQQDGRVSV